MHKRWSIININKKYFLKYGSKSFECQIGTNGLKNSMKKLEGDSNSAMGKWYLREIYYRADRVKRPKLKKKYVLKMHQITKHCGWCDDIRSNFYNKYIKIDNLIPTNISHEKLWREDEAYDIIIVISHNVKPIIKNKGSAIFIHCSFVDKRSTAGCIALKKNDILFLLKNLRQTTYLNI